MRIIPVCSICDTVCYLTTHPSSVTSMLWKFYPVHVWPRIQGSLIFQASCLGLQFHPRGSGCCFLLSMPEHEPLHRLYSHPNIRCSQERSTSPFPQPSSYLQDRALLQSQKTENTEIPYLTSSTCFFPLEKCLKAKCCYSLTLSVHSKNKGLTQIARK